MTTRDSIIQELHRRKPEITEAVSLQILALRPMPLGTFALSQLAEGGWSAGSATQPPNAYHTALALLALRSSGNRTTTAVRRGVAWLTRTRPAEVHWLWRWKFRLADRHVRFDPDEFGWPWVPGTVSWVAPTAMAILALRAFEVAGPRLDAGVAMLLDRACPAGGWNAGNSEVFGVGLDPHPDFTAMALLALNGIVPPDAPVIASALRYLGTRLRSCRSIYSLAWCAMALAAYQHPTRVACINLLDRKVDGVVNRAPTHALALASLALEDPTFTFQEFEP